MSSVSWSPGPPSLQWPIPQPRQSFLPEASPAGSALPQAGWGSPVSINPTAQQWPVAPNVPQGNWNFQPTGNFAPTGNFQQSTWNAPAGNPPAPSGAADPVVGQSIYIYNLYGNPFGASHQAPAVQPNVPSSNTPDVELPAGSPAPQAVTPTMAPPTVVTPPQPQRPANMPLPSNVSAPSAPETPEWEVQIIQSVVSLLLQCIQQILMGDNQTQEMDPKVEKVDKSDKKKSHKVKENDEEM